jgi:hypothetical protein
MEFFMITKKKPSYGNMSGILGLGAKSESANPLVIDNLYKSGAISAPVFALWYDNDDAFIDIGATFDDAMKKPDDLVLFDSKPGESLWTNTISQVRTRTPEGHMSK